MTEPDELLAADEVGHRFGDVQAVAGVSLEVDPAAVTAVIGPNGSGKTTLLRLMAGLLDPDDGRIVRPSSQTRSIGFLPQQPAFRPGFTVSETLRFYAQLAGAGRESVGTVLETVGLATARNREVQTLSGGMTGLLGIAQALLGAPRFVVLDEPTTGLDPGIKRHIFEVIDTLRSDGHGILLASHDLEQIEGNADEIMLLETGRLRAKGSVSELLSESEGSSLEAVYHERLTGDPTSVDIRSS